MKQERLVYLLQKSMVESTTDKEHLEMMELMNDQANEAQIKESLYNIYQSPKSVQDIQPAKSAQILDAILQSDREIESRKPYFQLWSFKWAAAAIIFAFLSIGFYFYFHKESIPVNQIAKFQNDVLPGGNHAKLTLADGSVIALTEASKGTIASQSGLIITKKADGQLLYKLNGQYTGDREGHNTISTPLGGKYEVILQDGTRVVLNAGSSITYPLYFSGSNREVTLTGEAYFEVAKNKHKPFIVSMPAAKGISAQEIEVLGTHFNVTAYSDEEAYVTTLLEGSIKIFTSGDMAGKILKPGEQAVVKKQINVFEVDAWAAAAWKDDIFYFADEPIVNLMRKLSRWYNIEVVYEVPTPKIGFWGQISRKKKLSEVLEVLEETNGVHFKIEGRRVIVMP